MQTTRTQWLMAQPSFNEHFKSFDPGFSITSNKKKIDKYPKELTLEIPNWVFDKKELEERKTEGVMIDTPLPDIFRLREATEEDLEKVDEYEFWASWDDIISLTMNEEDDEISEK